VLIAQISDVHVGGSRYREELLRAAIEEINGEEPDLVVVAGDLTDDGYPDQYPVAREELSALACHDVLRVPGNHDARNVGYLHFEDTFGARDSRLRLDCTAPTSRSSPSTPRSRAWTRARSAGSTTRGSRMVSPATPT
jgi:3',5'-cyclic-AMP phosphodiesterase